VVEFARVADALRWGEHVLTAEGINGPRIQATLLLGDAMGFDRAQLLARLSDPVPTRAAERYRDSVHQRASHVPLQYIRGRAPFLDFEVEVWPGVFIPRPETEMVVEEALSLWQPTAEAPWAIDVGTGSGIISIALARARPAARILAIDRSPVPLAAARQNARNLGVADQISFARADLLASLGPCGRPRTEDPTPPTTFPADASARPWAEEREGAGDSDPRANVRQSIGMIISNPPYAPQDSPDVDPEVRDHEPPEAWAAGPEGLDAYARLIPQAASLLVPGRPLVLELGYGQADLVSDLLTRDGRWSEPRILPDFNEIPRILTILRNESACV
jgi:release factor glutamine methyltransferase